MSSAVTSSDRVVKEEKEDANSTTENGSKSKDTGGGAFKGFSMGKMTKSKSSTKPSSSSSIKANGSSTGMSGANVIISHHDNNDSDDNDVEGGRKQLVTSIGRHGTELLAGEQDSREKTPLVIPLAVNPWQNKEKKTNDDDVNGSSSTAKAEKTLDEIAAESLAKEASAEAGNGQMSGALGMSSSLIIPLQNGKSGSDDDDDDDAGGGSEARKRSNSTQRQAPLLAANMIPGLKDVEGEDAKFRHDMSMRADDIHAESDVYRTVPVEEFGAALLRGMGWTGPKTGKAKEEEDALLRGFGNLRHHRLGLGAEPKPEDDMPTNKKRIRKPGEVARPGKEANERAWKKKAEEQAAKTQQQQQQQQQQRVTVGDVVSICNGHLKGKRAMVLRTTGKTLAAGELLCRMEDGGHEEVIMKEIVVVLGGDAKAKRPFSIRRSGEKVNGGGGGGGGDAMDLSDDMAKKKGSSGQERNRRSKSGSRNGSASRRSRSGSASRRRGSDNTKREREERDARDGGIRDRREGKDRQEKEHGKSKKRRRTSRSRSWSRSRSGDRDRKRDHNRDNGSSRHTKDRRKEHSRDRGTDHNSDRRGAGGAAGGGGGGDRRGDESRHDTKDKDKKSVGTGEVERHEAGGKPVKKNREDEYWLVSNIRVRVVSKSYGSKHHLSKGVVAEVTRPGEGTVRMESGSNLPGVKEKHLETVVPAVGGKVVVVKGVEGKGSTGKVMAKSTSKEQVMVQLTGDDPQMLTVHLDDVAEYTS